MVTKDVFNEKFRCFLRCDGFGTWNSMSHFSQVIHDYQNGVMSLLCFWQACDEVNANHIPWFRGGR